MTYQTLNVRREGSILYVDFNNPPVNLMNVAMVGELFDLAGSLAFDQQTAVVVFGSANPEFFIAHFDLDDLVKLKAATLRYRKASMTTSMRCRR